MLAPPEGSPDGSSPVLIHCFPGGKQESCRILAAFFAAGLAADRETPVSLPPYDPQAEKKSPSPFQFSAACSKHIDGRPENFTRPFE
jgi:hypothetical protein